jgi:hypothetical protein
MKTKKAAKEAGYFTIAELHSGYRRGRGTGERVPKAPLPEATPTVVKGEERWHVNQCETLMSRTAAAKIGLRLRDSAVEPTTTQSFNPGRRVEYRLYRLSEFVPDGKRGRDGLPV